MKTRQAIPLLAWAMLLSLPAVAAPPATDFKALMQKELDAWSTLDTDKAGAFFDKGADNVYYDIAPLKYNGWSEYAAGVKQNFPDVSSIAFTMHDDARTHQHGSLVWGTATVHTVLMLKSGTQQALDARWTVIWEKRGKDWLVVHEHFSAPLPAAPAQ
jgi:ketosteroid isomerase-like protein